MPPTRPPPTVRGNCYSLFFFPHPPWLSSHFRDKKKNKQGGKNKPRWLPPRNCKAFPASDNGCSQSSLLHKSTVERRVFPPRPEMRVSQPGLRPPWELAAAALRSAPPGLFPSKLTATLLLLRPGASFLLATRKRPGSHDRAKRPITK